MVEKHCALRTYGCICIFLVNLRIVLLKTHFSCQEQVIFTDPYHSVPINHWTSPQLDGFVQSLQSDIALKVAVAELKAKFLGSTEALLHGDLHTGSIMATEGSTFVIDPEFAFYGPFGFDIGAVIANLLLGYYSQLGYPGRDEYAEWLLSQTALLYELFEQKFVALWDEEGTGEAFKRGLFPSGSPALKAAQTAYLQRIFKDSLGFAGAKMIRRIVGIAHVADLESIEDKDVRASAEKKSLVLARQLILHPFASFAEVAGTARDLYSKPAPESFNG